MKYQASEIEAYARSLEPVLRDIRRDLHRHPELGHKEFRTAEVIRKTLLSLPDVKLIDLPGCPTGTAAFLTGMKPESGTIGIRCDIDALEILEKNTHSYVSETPGLMHACGHDGHVAVILGAAMILNKFRPDKNVRFLFQPAEECDPDGAPLLLAAGGIDGLDAVYGFHLNATSDFGNVGWYDGAVMAGGTRIRITVHGKSGHPAYPEGCINPVCILSRIWVEIETIRATIRGTRGCQLAPSSILSGTDFGTATPADGSITLRTCFLEKELDLHIRRKIELITKNICEIHGATYEIEYDDAFPITCNHPELGNMIREHAKEFGFPLEQIFPSMGSDDFGLYAQKIPAYYMTFGLRKGENFPLAHTPTFDFDEAILPVGAAMMASCVL